MTVTLAAYPQGYREGLMAHDTAYDGPSTILGTCCGLAQPPSGFEPPLVLTPGLCWNPKYGRM